MTEKKPITKPSMSADWFLQGALSRIGDTLDRFTGRRWTPSSSLATSELIERVKRIMDAEMREVEGKGRVVPHNIKLKVQWDKFSTDEEGALGKLEQELLTAAADHINDQLYYTQGPLLVEVKPDYFTEGVKLSVTFDKVTDDEGAGEMNVTLPSIPIEKLAGTADLPAKKGGQTFIAKYQEKGSGRERKLVFPTSGRLSIGRTKSNDLTIDDPSISKIHAALVVGPNAGLSVADTGSTNGTFINGERIPYGKALPVAAGDKLRFGTVEVELERLPDSPVAEPDEPSSATEDTEIDGFRFTSKIQEGSAERSVGTPEIKAGTGEAVPATDGQPTKDDQ